MLGRRVAGRYQNQCNAGRDGGSAPWSVNQNSDKRKWNVSPDAHVITLWGLKEVKGLQSRSPSEVTVGKVPFSPVWDQQLHAESPVDAHEDDPRMLPELTRTHACVKTRRPQGGCRDSGPT